MDSARSWGARSSPHGCVGTRTSRTSSRGRSRTGRRHRDPSPTRRAVPEVRANGLAIHYTVEGEGPPLILLHAATSSSLEDWAAQRPLLRQHFRIYLPDARGHARTRWDVADGWSYAVLVNDLF